MWQPFNGLEIFPSGTSNQTVDPTLFKEIPPALCKKKGGATFRIKCDDDGMPVIKDDAGGDSGAALTQRTRCEQRQSETEKHLPWRRL